MKSFRHPFHWLLLGLSLLLTLLFLPFSPQSSTPPTVVPAGTSLGLSFVPVQDDVQRAFTAPILADLNVSRIRFGEQWKLREKQPGVFNWEPLDERLQWAQENKLAVLLTIQSDGPEWACASTRSERSCVYTNTQAFQRYVTTLLRRYPNQIERIQFGNEWQSQYGYPGTAVDFITTHNILYEAVQEHSPDTTVVLGGFSIGALRSLAFCDGSIEYLLADDGNRIPADDRQALCTSPTFTVGYQQILEILANARYDMIDIHLYDDVEHWSMYHRVIRDLTPVPIVVSEFGGPHPVTEPTNETYQAQRFREYIIALRALDITDAYYFTLVESATAVHTQSGLIEADTLRKKSVYEAFKQIN